MALPKTKKRIVPDISGAVKRAAETADSTSLLQRENDKRVHKNKGGALVPVRPTQLDRHFCLVNKRQSGSPWHMQKNKINDVRLD